MTGPADQVPLSVARQLAAALRDALGAVDALSTQVERMRGMFPDDDGTIGEAVKAGEDAGTAGDAALSDWREFEAGAGQSVAMPDPIRRAVDALGALVGEADLGEVDLDDEDRAKLEEARQAWQAVRP